jgi:formylglycine-generating enzyme required for sulfatase activity
MGSDVASDKAPAPRRVQITAAFYMSENEVSSAAYERVLGRGAGGDERTPKSGLSWKDAKRFCDKADLFLPSEAQWEYACRASGSERFAFGASVDEDEAVTRELGRNAPQPAGERAANAFGLRDMHGNVAEFCLDEYLAPEDYAKLAPTDPLAKRGKGQVLRGGSYLSASNFCAAATRKVVDDPEAPVLDAGLRVVLKLD